MEEVPVGALLRFGPSAGVSAMPVVILGVDSSHAKTIWHLWENTRFEVLLEHAEHSTDLGKTWHKCGVKIQ